MLRVCVCFFFLVSGVLIFPPPLLCDDQDFYIIEILGLGIKFDCFILE
jgi:surface polysaccharide O-acyltransferase-like enzyme